MYKDIYVYLPSGGKEFSRVWGSCLFSWNRDNALDKTIFGNSNMANITSKPFVECLLDIICHLINSASIEPGGTFAVILACFLDTVWEFSLQHL